MATYRGTRHQNEDNETDASASSGRPITFGWTTTGKHLAVVWEEAGDRRDEPMAKSVQQKSSGRRRRRPAFASCANAISVRNRPSRTWKRRGRLDSKESGRFFTLDRTVSRYFIRAAMNSRSAFSQGSSF